MQNNCIRKKVSPESIDRIYYDTVGEFVDRLILELSRSKVVTLSTKDGWWARGLITPYAGTLEGRCKGYAGPFCEEQILKDLRLSGLNVAPHSKVKHFYFIRCSAYKK